MLFQMFSWSGDGQGPLANAVFDYTARRELKYLKTVETETISQVSIMCIMLWFILETCEKLCDSLSENFEW